MAGYEDTYKKIVDTLTGRPAGHEIQPYEHEAFALSLLDYIRSVETATNSMFAGSANGSTAPIQPPTSNVAYLSTVSGGSTVTYTNFKDVSGNSITVTCAANKGKVVILMWNKQYWSSQEVEVEANVPSPVGMAFMGIADTTTVPPSGTSWAYLTATPGTYTYFNNSVVTLGQLVAFTYDKNNDLFKKTVLVDLANLNFQNLDVQGNLNLAGMLNRFDFTQCTNDVLTIQVCQTLDISKVGEKIEIQIPDGYVAHMSDGEYVGYLKYCSYFNGYTSWFISYNATIAKTFKGFGTWYNSNTQKVVYSDRTQTETQTVTLNNACAPLSFHTPDALCIKGGTKIVIEVTASGFPATYVEDNQNAVIPKILIWGNIRCFKRPLKPEE